MIGLRTGRHLVDLENPKADQIDLDAITTRLAYIRRFSGDPAALTVSQHSRLVHLLAMKAGAAPEVVTWCVCHDFHEGIIGDIPGPLKAYLREFTSALGDLEERLDAAIAMALGVDTPSAEVRRRVGVFDRQAETLEWLYVLGFDPQPWNVWIPDYGVDLLRQVQPLVLRPEGAV